MKTVFISGASSDIGLALCKLFLEKEGEFQILGHYRTMRPEFACLCGDGKVEPLQMDFSSVGEFEKSLSRYSEQLKQADIFINLAASYPDCSFETASSADILRTLEVNLLPGLLLTQLIGPEMVKRGWGRIVHASSIGVKFGGGKTSFTYSLSKHCQEFIPASCRAWAKDNVLVNIARVGVTDTRIHSGKSMEERAQLIPMKRIAKIEEIAKSLRWLVSSDNSYMTNEVITIAGGE